MFLKAVLNSLAILLAHSWASNMSCSIRIQLQSINFHQILLAWDQTSEPSFQAEHRGAEGYVTGALPKASWVPRQNNLQNS